MNFVSVALAKNETTLSDLCRKHGNCVLNKNGPHAFIGKCGGSEMDKVFLISFDRIIELDNMVSWDLPGCPVVVKEFVELSIQAKPMRNA